MLGRIVHAIILISVLASSNAVAGDAPTGTTASPPVPLFFIAEPSQKSPHVVVDFTWSPYCGYCVRAFHDVIFPFMNSFVKTGYFSVRVIQDTRNKAELNGPGPLFLCVPPDKYAGYVSEYLDMSYLNKAYLSWKKTPKIKVGDHVVPKYMVEIGKKYGLPDDINQCYTNTARTILIVARKYVDETYHPSRTPVFGFNKVGQPSFATYKELEIALNKYLHTQGIIKE